MQANAMLAFTIVVPKIFLNDFLHEQTSTTEFETIVFQRFPLRFSTKWTHWQNI